MGVVSYNDPLFFLALLYLTGVCYNDTHLESDPSMNTSQHTSHSMDLTQEQRNTLNELTRLITDKYEEQLWNECYYPEENHEIRDLLSTLQQRGVEVNFSVTLTPYDNNLV